MMILRHEFRRFKCPQFKIVAEIKYSYSYNDELVGIHCSIKNNPLERKKCNGSLPFGEECIIFAPYPGLNKVKPHESKHCSNPKD